MTALRTARQITTGELAEQANLPSAVWIADVEAGRRPVPSVYFAPLAREYGISVKEFATLCLSYYDPRAYDALFGADAVETLKVAA